MEAVLEARKVSAGYGSAPVVRDLDLHVGAGEVVVLLGPNGAGKTTTMLALAGELSLAGGEVRDGGTPVSSALHRRARSGLGFVSEERSVFAGMSVADNLRVGRCDVGFALDLFPELRHRLRVAAGLLSGGEQQMLALARALARRPRVLLADELSLGLAPLAVARLHEAVRTVASEGGVGVLLVEQHVRKVLRIADRVYVMQRGAVSLEGPADRFRDTDLIERSYLSA